MLDKEGKMDLDQIMQYIQSFFDRGTVTVVGSGLSCAEGIPGMSMLANKLIEEVPLVINEEEQIQWNLIADKLRNGIDLETALQQETPCENIEKAILDVTYNLITDADNRIFHDVILKDKSLRFTKYLSRFNLSLYNKVVITTNYDLLIEYACELGDVFYTDTYAGKIVAEFSPEKARSEMIKEVQRGRKSYNTYYNYVELYKPHGSINWKNVDNHNYRINHKTCGVPCLITPGSNKYLKGYASPFDYHINKMGENIDNSKKIVFIGYGFNDNHLETHLNNACNLNKPMLIITRTLSENGKSFLKKNSNTMALEYYQEGDEKGTVIHWQGGSMRIKDIALWDLGFLIGEIF